MESDRKSGRTSKGKMTERADKIVEMPQAKVKMLLLLLLLLLLNEYF